jgi:hypothetical protein
MANITAGPVFRPIAKREQAAGSNWVFGIEGDADAQRWTRTRVQAVTLPPLASQPSFSRSSRPGTILVREWQGTTHHATVVADGFVWNGRSYSSLSAIARAITGTKWNGYRFFGLREDDDRV